MTNEKLLEITKDIIITMIENEYILRDNDDVVEAIEVIFNKISELSN